MTVSTSVPTTIEIRRSRLLGLVAMVAAIAAVVTWALVALAFNSNSSNAQPSSSRAAFVASPAPRGPSIMSLTPAGLAANALGTGYQLPTAQHGPTLDSVLASMSPATRRYTKALMQLTFAQLAAGAAGHP
jgi:hypothetical protein